MVDLAGVSAGNRLDVVGPAPARLEHEATDRAGYQAAEQIVAALQGGSVTTAVNAATIKPEDMEELGPFLPLCRHLGRLRGGGEPTRSSSVGPAPRSRLSAEAGSNPWTPAEGPTPGGGETVSVRRNPIERPGSVVAHHLVWRLVGGVPEVRTLAAVAYDTHRRRLVVFGGGADVAPVLALARATGWRTDAVPTRDPVDCDEAKTTRSYVGCDYWPTVTPKLNGISGSDGPGWAAAGLRPSARA